MNKLEITYNRSLQNGIENISWDGIDFPWEMTSVDIEADSYSGYTVVIHFEGGETTLWANSAVLRDVSPPPEICQCCNQEIPYDRLQQT